MSSVKPEEISNHLSSNEVPEAKTGMPTQLIIKTIQIAIQLYRDTQKNLQIWIHPSVSKIMDNIKNEPDGDKIRLESFIVYAPREYLDAAKTLFKDNVLPKLPLEIEGGGAQFQPYSSDFKGNGIVVSPDETLPPSVAERNSFYYNTEILGFHYRWDKPVIRTETPFRFL